MMIFSIPSWHQLHKNKDNAEVTSSAAKSGLPPGSLVHIGEQHTTESKITVTQYNAEKLVRHEIATIEELRHLDKSEVITWINIDGLIETNIVADIGKEFNIHPLVLEDILSTHQRPKLEENDDYVYFVVKVLTVFATIFIPLTFIAGIYGMNFEYMPELKWRWAYPALWVFFIFVSVSLLLFFKKKNGYEFV